MSRVFSERLTLPAEPGSARNARSFVRRQLSAWGCEELLEPAVLCVSELVTNAVVHTRGAVSISLSWDAPRLRVELRDHSRSAAIGARTLAAVGGHAVALDDDGVPAPEATSGRGLLIVTSLAALLGERIDDEGKTLWFELHAGRGDGAGPAAIIQQDVSDRGRNGSGHNNGNGGHETVDPRQGVLAGVGKVQLLDVPVAVAVASDDHLNDLARELSLDTRSPLAGRLLAAIADVGGSFPYDTHWRERVRSARVFGTARLDFELEVDLDRLAALRGVAGLLDEADAAMQSGRLLALSPPPAVREFRRWAVEEMAAQLAGAPPGRPPESVSHPPPAARRPVVDDLVAVASSAARSLMASGSTEHVRLAERLERTLEGLRRELEAKNRLLEERAKLLATLEESLRPEDLPDIPGLALAGRYRAGAADVGGDFYDVFPLQGTDWGFVIGDVCGKGVGAAAKTALARHTLRTAAMLEPDPAVVLRVLNDALLARGETESFCSALFARLCPGPGGARGEVVVAGHPRPLLRRASGEVERLATGGSLLGIVDDDVALRVPVTLSDGDILVLYTDGVTEARRGHTLFGEDRLVDVLARASGSVEEVAGSVEEAVYAFADHERADDVALLLISPTA